MYKSKIRQLINKASSRVSGIGAIPVGLKFTIAGVKMYVEAQFDIYNKVHLNIIDQSNGKTIVRIDGLASNKKRQALSLLMYVRANSTAKLPEFMQVSRSTKLDLRNTSRVHTAKQMEKDVTAIVNELSSEVALYNNSGSKTKRTVKPVARKTTTTKSKTTKKRTAAKPKAKTAAKRSKTSTDSSTGVLKYSKALGGGKYEYKYVKKKK